jgi:hypothetical protein
MIKTFREFTVIQENKLLMLDYGICSIVGTQITHDQLRNLQHYHDYRIIKYACLIMEFTELHNKLFIFRP